MDNWVYAMKIQRERKQTLSFRAYSCFYKRKKKDNREGIEPGSPCSKQTTEWDSNPVTALYSISSFVCSFVQLTTLNGGLSGLSN